MGARTGGSSHAPDVQAHGREVLEVSCVACEQGQTVGEGDGRDHQVDRPSPSGLAVSRAGGRIHAGVGAGRWGVERQWVQQRLHPLETILTAGPLIGTAPLPGPSTYRITTQVQMADDTVRAWMPGFRDVALEFTTQGTPVLRAAPDGLRVTGMLEPPAEDDAAWAIELDPHQIADVDLAYLELGDDMPVICQDGTIADQEDMRPGQQATVTYTNVLESDPPHLVATNSSSTAEPDTRTGLATRAEPAEIVRPQRPSSTGRA